MNEGKIESIKNDVRSMMEGIANYGGPLPNHIRDVVEKALNHAESRISEFRQGQKQEIITAPTPPGSDLLWILSGSNPDAFVQYLATFPDPAFQTLLQNPVKLQQTINQLQQRMPQGVPQIQNGIPKADLQSSNVWGFAYNPKDGKLMVKFNSGSVYEYGGVPAYIFNAFKSGAAAARTDGKNKWGAWWRGKSPSLGSALNQYVKELGFPYQKVS